MNEFRHPELKQLTDQQVRYAPPARRREQVRRAEELLGSIDSEKLYPYPFVCFRITDYRPDEHAHLLISGRDLAHDLGLFIRLLEKSIPPLPIEQAVEPMLTLEEISNEFGVSTKTISRWRVKGLVGQRVVRDGRLQLGFPRSVVARFAKAHPDRVARGRSFSRLSDEEKEEILRRASRLAQAGGTLTEVSRRIARKMGRSIETVRYTIKNHDRRDPTHAVFPSSPCPLSGVVKDRIYDSYREGVSVDKLAKEYGRTRTSMYRVINEVRAERLLQQPLDYIYHESFDDPKMEAEILAPMPDLEKFERERHSKKPPADVPPEFAALYECPLLTKAQEQHLFRQMNFLKHKLNKLRQKIDPARVRVKELQQVEEYQQQIDEVRQMLVQCNMRLVVSIAKKHVGTGDNIFELVSDGNVSLIRAVEKFDFSRGNKFSTYASWAIIKNFARSIPGEKTYRERYITGHEEIFDAKPDGRGNEQELLAQAEQARARINTLLADLDPRTREVIRMRAGLDGAEGMTLEQIGRHFGITKERVRQINVRGMKQLREKAMAEKIDLP